MNQFEPLSSDEVLFVSIGRILMRNPTFKVGELLDKLAQVVSDFEDDWTDEHEGWFSQGLDCEAFRFGSQGWQRGRVRLRLEFCPEQPDRPKALNFRREERRADEPVTREDYSSRPDSSYGSSDYSSTEY